jgi:hypothetical protein
MRRRLAAALLVLGLPAVAAAGPTHPAAADPISSCSTTVGVIVVVDFSPWGGQVERGCAPTATDGYDALIQAGFTPSGDAQDGAAFICRIDDDPTPAQTPCATTPPASATWSYWHAPAGQSSWSYSTLGAMSYHPPPGSVDAWTFGQAGTPPTFSPTAVRATDTSPPPSAPPTTSPVAPTTAPTIPSTIPSANGPSDGSPAGSPSATAPGGTSAGVARAGALGPGTSGSTEPAPGLPMTSGVSGGTPTTVHPSGCPTTTVVEVGHIIACNTGPIRVIEATPMAVSPAGSPLPFVLGALVVVALGAVGVVAARRRRRPDPTGEE